MNYIIITGASKGLGEGIALELLHETHHLICVSRSKSEKLEKLAAAKNCPITFISFDFAVTFDVPDLARMIFEHIPLDKASGVYLINNAGVIEPVGRVEECAPEAVEQHLRINLISPILLTGAFIQHTRGWKMEKRVINISSGAAKILTLAGAVIAQGRPASTCLRSVWAPSSRTSTFLLRSWQ
jgi:benzil reductase ((S)-benzoin forming)